MKALSILDGWKIKRLIFQCLPTRLLDFALFFVKTVQILPPKYECTT